MLEFLIEFISVDYVAFNILYCGNTYFRGTMGGFAFSFPRENLFGILKICELKEA